MTLTEIEKKWGNKPITPDEWATMSDEEAAVLLRREIWGNFAYRGYYPDGDELLENCRKAVYCVRNFTFSKPKYKIVTQYKHDLTIDAGGPWYITWDLKIVCGDQKVKYTNKYDMVGTFGHFSKWAVSPTEYRRYVPHIGRDHVAKMTKEVERLWEEIKAAIPATVAKHTKSGKVEDKAVTKMAELIGHLGDRATLDFVKILLKYHNQACSQYILDFLSSLNRNGATVAQMTDQKIEDAWNLAGVKKTMAE
jgi:hypothetical protein